VRIGIPKEASANETRVGLTPFGVARLAGLGHQLYVEHDAGRDAHWSDEDYAAAGAAVVYQRDEVYQRAELVCRVGPLAAGDVEHLSPETAVCGFQHLAVAPKEVVAAVAERRLTLIGYETLADAAGRRPVQAAVSEIAAQLAVHTAAHLLEHRSGGRGVLLGSIPGVPPATVVILGAGNVGRTAARLFLLNGAHVILLDADVERLRTAVAEGGHPVPGRPVTAYASERHLRRYTAIADVLVGAAVVPGGRAPYLVSEELVRAMKPGSVVIDVAIDQGGCVATSRPTTAQSPTFTRHGVVHHCVPNMPAAVPRTASRALTLAALPYLARLAEEGIERALAADPGLARGVFLYRGRIVNATAAGALGMESANLDDLLGEARP
jgi:alanine dehydrogenase